MSAKLKRLGAGEEKTDGPVAVMDPPPIGGQGHWSWLIIDGLAACVLLSLLFIAGSSGGDSHQTQAGSPVKTAPAKTPKPAGEPSGGSAPGSGPRSIIGDEPLEQMLSRPVALDAEESPANQPQGGARKEYRIRFAVCQLEESCLEVKERMKEKGIEVKVVRDNQSITVYHAAVGPWPTASHASEAARKLSERGLNGSILSSGDKFYLITPPRFFASAVEQDLAAVAGAGYAGKAFSRKETQRMYKAYAEFFTDYQAAKRRLDFYRKKKVDCLLEEN